MLQFLIEKEFKQIRRNAFLPKLILAMPLMMMLIYPWAVNLEIKNVKLSIVDNDHSVYSERLIQKIGTSGYFKLTDILSSYPEAMQSIESGEADFILEIQDEFEKSLINEGAARVMISANSVNSTKGGLGSTYLSAILGDYAGELREEQRGQVAVTLAEIPSFGVISQFKFNPHLDYKVFMIPALMVFLMTFLCVLLNALNIVIEN